MAGQQDVNEFAGVWNAAQGAPPPPGAPAGAKPQPAQPGAPQAVPGAPPGTGVRTLGTPISGKITSTTPAKTPVSQLHFSILSLQSKKKLPQKKKSVKKKAPEKREIMNEGDTDKNFCCSWRVIKLLGSGGFGDVYKVVKQGDADKTVGIYCVLDIFKEAAMKTEMVIGDRRMLRLKIEVLVLMKCHEQTDPNCKQHFVAFVDRGKTEKFKFLVMGLVWKSLEDIRKDVLGHNYSRSTVIQCSLQTLIAVRDLHRIGYLHRKVWPQNYACGLGEQQSIIYMLDFGIARKYTVGDTNEIKVPRAKVSFLGTVRFASRACHKCIEQGRKDDLESWIFMSAPWVLRDNEQMENPWLMPKYITNSINSIAKENKIDVTRKLDWIGVPPKPPQKKKKEVRLCEFPFVFFFG
uniref:Protein kinase domain-containing protein n=1 Tax=Angiostrongylus cantonensis TaxID=6313 RepID=A0A0K0DCN6_ANGCA